MQEAISYKAIRIFIANNYESQYNIFVACPSGTRRCDNGDCVASHLWCNSYDNCGDWSDETNCSTFYGFFWFDLCSVHTSIHVDARAGNNSYYGSEKISN